MNGRRRSFAVAAGIGLTAVLAGSNAFAASLCANPKQASEIQEAYKQRPGVAPLEIGKKLGLSEEIVLTGLPKTQRVGTSDGQAFAKVWGSLAEWERPVVVLPLANDNVVEIFGPIGTKVAAVDGEVRIENERQGVGGHFHPSTIAAIHVVTIPRTDRQTLHGAVFLGADGQSIISVYSLQPTKPAVISFFSSDAYQRTRDLVASLPPHCP